MRTNTMELKRLKINLGSAGIRRFISYGASRLVSCNAVKFAFNSHCSSQDISKSFKFRCSSASLMSRLTVILGLMIQQFTCNGMLIQLESRFCMRWSLGQMQYALVFLCALHSSRHNSKVQKDVRKMCTCYVSRFVPQTAHHFPTFCLSLNEVSTECLFKRLLDIIFDRMKCAPALWTHWTWNRLPFALKSSFNGIV